MEKEKLERINYLARKKKAGEALSDAELAEQKALREEYLREFRASFTGILENTYLERPDGSREKLQKGSGKGTGTVSVPDGSDSKS